MDSDNLNLVNTNWINKYTEDGLEAMKQLVNFFLRVRSSTLTTNSSELIFFFCPVLRMRAIGHNV